MKNDKIPVTIIVPVKNEEKNLPHCLKLLSNFNQIMVVDSGSTDRTKDISLEYGAEYHLFEWNGQFPKKRNWALRNLDIKNNWVLFLDADEYVTEAFVSELEQKIKSNEYVGYWIKYTNYFMGKTIKHGYPLLKLPLFKVGSGEYEKIEEDNWSYLDMEVHEHPILNGKTGRIKAPVLHNDYKGLESYIAKHNGYSSWEANRTYKEQMDRSKMTFQQKLKYTLLNLGLLHFGFFIGSYFLLGGFLDGRRGFILAKYKANYFFQIQTKLRELRDNASGN